MFGAPSEFPQKENGSRREKNIPAQVRSGIWRRIAAGLNEKKKNPIKPFKLDWMKTYDFGSHRRPRVVLFRSTNSEKHRMSHNAPVTNTDKIRQERRHASSRARDRQPLFFLAAQVRKLSALGPLG